MEALRLQHQFLEKKLSDSTIILENSDYDADLRGDDIDHTPDDNVADVTDNSYANNRTASSISSIESERIQSISSNEIFFKPTVESSEKNIFPVQAVTTDLSANSHKSKGGDGKFVEAKETNHDDSVQTGESSGIDDVDSVKLESIECDMLYINDSDGSRNNIDDHDNNDDDNDNGNGNNSNNYDNNRNIDSNSDCPKDCENEGSRLYSTDKTGNLNNSDLDHKIVSKRERNDITDENENSPQSTSFTIYDAETDLFLRNKNMNEMRTLDPVSPPSPHAFVPMRDEFDKAQSEIDAFNSAENGSIIAAGDSDNDDDDDDENHNSDTFEINNSFHHSSAPPLLEHITIIMPKIHSYKMNQFLPLSMISENKLPDFCDMAVESIVSLLTPQEEQIKYRASARAFLGRTVRHALKAKLFESGLHALSSFLPDDPIRLTLLLWRGNSTNWLSNLGDKMRSIELQPIGINSSGVSSSTYSTNSSVGSSGLVNFNHFNSMGVFDDEAFNEQNGLEVDNEPKPTGEHTLSNINPSSTLGQSRIFCNIDAIAVEIIPNGRSDLCFLAFIEEISQLVGKNKLFKRSLLLIRGWWVYETSVYIGVPSKNLLPDPVLSMLVCSIFNQYHTVIHQPLQALSIFLAEYSDIKWCDVAITLQGVVPFHTTGILENQPFLREPLESDLIKSCMIQKHCDFYHMSSNSNNASRASATPRVSGTGECTPLTLDTPVASDRHLSEIPEGTPLAFLILGSSTTTTFENTAPNSVSATPYGSGTVPTAVVVAAAAAALLSGKEPFPPGGSAAKKAQSDSSHCYSPTAVRNFQKRLINIVHPLTNANMISTSITVDRATKISNILQAGATELNNSLKNYYATKVEKEYNTADDEDINNENEIFVFNTKGDGNHTGNVATSPFDNFFRGILQRFSTGWRPDIFDSPLPGYGNRATEGAEKDQNKVLGSGGGKSDVENCLEVESGSKILPRSRYGRTDIFC